MGNALNNGSGLTLAEVSVMESYYGDSVVGAFTESRTTTEENSASGSGHTRTQQRFDSRVRSGTKSDSKSISSHQRSSTKIPQRRSSRTNEFEDTETRTESSSAYHHGYRLPGEVARGDIREGIDENEGRYDGYDDHHAGHHHESRRRSPKKRDAEQSNHNNFKQPVMSNSSSVLNVKSKSSSHPHLHQGTHLRSKESAKPQSPQGHHHQQQDYQSDAEIENEPQLGLYPNIPPDCDIPEAETDMAFDGSKDEDELQAIRDKEIASYYAAEHQDECVVVEKPHSVASESLEHKERARALLRESEDDIMIRQQQEAAQRLLQRVQDEEEAMLREQQVAAQLLLQQEAYRQSQDESLLRQQQEAAYRLLQSESLLRQQQAQMLLGGADTDSFSTLTKTLSTAMVSPLPTHQDNSPALQNDNRSGQREIASSPVPDPGVDAALINLVQIPTPQQEEDEDNPAQQKLEDLLMQQQLQEEKLEKQLEQLRVQKDRLKQLQEEKIRSPSMTTKCSQEGNNSVEIHQTRNLHARNEELRIQKERMQAVKSEPSKDGAPTLTMEDARQEHTRRMRLEAAREKVCPPRPKESSKASNNEEEHLVASKKSGDNQTNTMKQEATTVEASEKLSKAGQESTATGTATGEMDVSFPEFDDIPSRLGIDSGAPRPYQEELTTLSASLTEQALDNTDYPQEESPVVSSIKELADDEQDNLDALASAGSSMDEEIDLVFVARYDEAFNAFLEAHPAMFDQDSDLIQNLKVAKLQRILEASYQTECDLESRLETPEAMKTNMEAEFQQQLKEAARNKAERSIQFQAQMNKLKKQSRAKEAKLTWDMLLLAVNRARKLYKINSELSKKELNSRHDLLASLPDTNLMSEVIRAVEAKPRDSFDDNQKAQLQQYQVDNAFLSSEVRVLQQKVGDLTKHRGRQEELDHALLHMDSKKLKKLKKTFQKKMGATF